MEKASKPEKELEKKLSNKYVDYAMKEKKKGNDKEADEFFRNAFESSGNGD